MASIAEDAAASTTLGQMRALRDRMASGARLTRLGNPSLADAKALAEAFGRPEEFDPLIGDRVFHTVSATEVPSVNLVWRWARAARLVRIAKGVAYPSLRARRLGADPLEDVFGLFHAFLTRFCWVRARYPAGRIPFYAEDLCEAAPEVVRTIARAGGDPVDLAGLAGNLTLWLAERWDLSGMSEAALDGLPGRVAGDLWWGIAVPLGELGVLELEGGPRPGGGSSPTAERSVRITVLGVYAETRLSSGATR